jgi:hypothetical protein
MTAFQRTELGGSQREVSAEASAISAAVPPERCPPADTGVQPLNDDVGRMKAENFTHRDVAIVSADGSDGASPSQTLSPLSAISPGASSPPLEQTVGSALVFLVPKPAAREEPGRDLERVSSVPVLSRLAANARLFRSADGRFCAQVPVGDRLEIYQLKSAEFRDWLIDGYLIDQPEPPSS